jgi:hypothetical protein
MWDFECKLRLLQGRGGVVPRSGETIGSKEKRPKSRQHILAVNIAEILFT